MVFFSRVFGPPSSGVFADFSKKACPETCAEVLFHVHTGKAVYFGSAPCHASITRQHLSFPKQTPKMELAHVLV